MEQRSFLVTIDDNALDADFIRDVLTVEQGKFPAKVEVVPVNSKWIVGTIRQTA